MGWDSDRVVEILYEGAPPPAELPIMQQWWEDVGVKTKLVQSPPGTDIFYGTKEFEVYYGGGWGQALFLPDGTRTSCDEAAPGAGRNATQYCNPEYDALISQALATLDEDERNALFAQSAKIFNRDIPWTTTYAPQSLLLVSEKLRGWRESICGPKGCNTLKAITDIETWYFEE